MKTITNLPFRLNLRHFFSAVFLFFSMAVSAQYFLKTVPPLNGGNSSSGTTFNVTANQTLRIDSIFGTFGAGAFEVWYSTTAISGPPTITTLNGWIQIGTGLTITTTTPTGTIKPLPKDFGLIIPAGQTYGFYVGGSSTTYSNGTAGVSAPFTDGIMTIETGNLVGYGGVAPNPTFHVRQFNGGIKYTVLGGMNDAAVLSVDSPTVFCAGNQNIYATIANFGGNQINSVTVNWSFDGVIQTPISYTGLLDTLNGLGNTAQIFLGNRNFPSGTPKAIKVWTSLPNGVADTSNFNDTISVVKGAAISGNYTVNSSLPASSTNFTSISSLNQLFSFGICGPVNVAIAPGTYNESLKLNNVSGASATNTITIDGGDSSTTILTQDGTSAFGTLIISGTDYVSVKNLSLISTAAVANSGVIVANSDHVSITNCNIEVNQTSTLSTIYAVSLSGSASSHTTGSFTDHFTLSNNVIKGGYYGIRAYGSTTKGVNNLTISNNDFENQYYYGAYFYYTDSLTFTSNDINMLTRANTFAPAAYLYYSSNFNVSENKLFATSYGIYIYNFTTPFPIHERGRVVNNYMYSSNNFGFYTYYTDSLDIYHNTIVSNGSSTPAAQMYASTTNLSEHIDMRNNILYSNGSFALRTNVSDLTMFDTLDYNLYYTSGASLFSINSVTYANLGAYTTAQAGFNANSIEGDPNFLNYPFDFHLIGALANDAGDNSVGVTIDYDGDSRPIGSSTIVDIGADEFNPPLCTPPTSVTFTNVTLNSADINITGGATSSWRFEYGISGFTLGTGSSVLTSSTTTSISGLNSGTVYEVYVREICSATDSSPVVGPYTFGTSYAAPYHEDFESFPAGQVGTSFTNGWSSNIASSSWGWESEQGTGVNTNSVGTGPLWDRTNFGVANGIYMYMETSSGTVGDTAILSSPPIYILPTMNVVSLKYSLFNFGTLINRMDVLVDTNGVSNVVATYLGPQQTAQTDPWIDATVALAGYAGKSVTIKFRGVNVACCDGDIAIDEVHIFEPASQEIGITDLTAPTTQCGLSATEPVTIEITNFGLLAASNFPATFVVDGSTTVTETVTASILPGNSLVYTFTGTANLATPGPHTVDAYVSLSGDTTKNNDSIFTSLTNIPVIASFPYNESFENGAGGWTVQGTGSSFALGTPAGTVINSASEGTKAWVTNLTGNYNNSEAGWVQSPCMDMSNLGIPLLEFDIWWESEFSWDGAVLQSSIDGGASWQKIGSFGAGGWYTDNSITGLQSLEPSQEGWSGNGTGTNPGSGGWAPMKVLLDTLANQPAVLFRFAYGSDGSVNSYEGFAFDNFRLYDSIQTNIQIDSMVTLLSDCGLNPAEDIIVSITNTGSTPFIKTPITYVINNGTPVTDTITDTIKGNTNYIYTFNTKANFSVAGGYALDVYLTVSPADSVPANDSLSVNIVRSPSTVMDTTATTDAFTDFEIDNGGFSAYGANFSWAWGTPSSFYIPAAASGTKAWVTGLSAGHNANELSYLETQCYDFSGIAASEPVYIQFKNIFKTQTGLDNIWMERSLDNGKTWSKVLAAVTAVNWYNNTTTQVWSGFSSGGVGTWIPVVNEILGLGGNSKVKFRFVMQSDGTVQNEGFGIDDFRVNLTVGEDENLLNADAILSVQPNPSNGQFNLVFNNYAKGVYLVEVMNVNGQLINAENVAVASKFQSKPMNLDNLEKGVYFVKVSNGNGVTTQKLVIK